ncbi:MAG: DNA adenine methylase [Leucobacter sp.]|nr:DNA adenine methylase [Leucobacter sp.]
MPNLADLELLTIYASSFASSAQPQPFPMQGSKRAQVPIINKLIPEDAALLIEPFCGSAAVSIGALQAKLVQGAVISDLNMDLVRLWESILDRPQELNREYAEIWAAQFNEQGEATDPRGYFNSIRERFNNATPEQRSASDFLFLLNRIVKAALRYGKGGQMNQSSDGRRTGAKPSTVSQRIQETADLMRTAAALHRDWREGLDQATSADVVYLDPPYQGTTETRDQRYVSGLAVEDFEEGLRGAIDRDLSLIVSYDALVGPATYGRPLDPRLGLLGFDVITGVSAQGTLLGRKQEAHETLYISPALVERLGGANAVIDRVATRPEALFEL